MSEYPPGPEFRAPAPARVPFVTAPAKCPAGNHPDGGPADVGELLPDDHDAWAEVSNGDGAVSRA